MGLHDFTIYDMIKRNAKCFRQRTAWLEVSDGRALTFGQFKDLVDRVACGLQDGNIEKGDRIGVVGRNNLEYFALYGAASALGAIMLPINWRLSADEIFYNLADGRVRFLFIAPEFQGLIQSLRYKLLFVEKYYNLGKEGAFMSFEQLLDNRGYFESVQVSRDDGIVIIHTAAVAGRPRGALLTNDNILLSNIQLGYRLKVTPDDINLNILPLYHVAGFFMVTLIFHAGGLNINLNKFDGEQAVNLIQEKRITILYEFHPALASILEHQEKTGADITSLRVVIGLDSFENIERYRKVTGGEFFSGYGRTEVTTWITFGHYNQGTGMASRPLPLVDVVLVDDYDAPVPDGQVGEITVKGPMVFKRYWNLPGDTDNAFRGGRYHTGDTARFDEDGFLHYVGRKPEEDMIKTGGENVYPAEVEKVLLEHPAIEKAVVFGVPDSKWKEGIKAVCQLKEGQTLVSQQLIDFVGKRIARYKKPQYVEVITDFPVLEDCSPDRIRIKKLHGGIEQ